MRIEVLSSGSAAGNAHWISDGTTHLLLDCGIPRKQIAAKLHEMKLPGIDAVLVTHGHQDHAKAVKELLRIGQDVYMSQGTADALGVADRAHILQARHLAGIGTWMVRPFLVEHDAAEPLGFVLTSGTEKLLYVTDCPWVPVKVSGLTHVMIESDYSLQKIRENVGSGVVDPTVKHRVLWNHMSIDTVLKFLRETDRSRLQGVWLLHLSDANADEAEFKQRVAELVGCPVHVA